MANESTEWLYGQLTGKGYNVGKSVEEFDSLMRTNAESRQWAYDTATKSGLNVGKDIDEFSSLVGGEPADASVGKGMAKVGGVLRDVVSDNARLAAWGGIAVTDDERDMSPVLDADGGGGQPMGSPYSGGGSVEPWRPSVSERIGKMAKVDGIVNDFSSKAKDGEDNVRRKMEQNTVEGLAATERGRMQAQMLGVPTHVSGISKGLLPEQDDADAEDQTAPRAALLTSSPKVRGVVMVDGKPTTEWLLPDGSVTTDIRKADEAEARARETRKAVDMSVGAQIRRAEAELEELKQRLAQRSNEVFEEFVKFEEENQAPLSSVLAGRVYQAMQIGDKEKRALQAAIRQREEQIKDLYEERDRQAGKDVGFWRGFGRTMGDYRTWDFGMGDLLDATTMLDADQYSSPDATEGEKKAGQAMMRAVYDRQQAEQMYGGNASFLNRAGVMTGYIPSFILDFALTDGGYEVINVAGKAAAHGAAKVIGKEAIKEMAELGVKRYAKKHGVRGVGRMAENWTIKALGTTADDLLIRAPLMANTVQAGKTMADIIDRKLGDVVIDENGNYDFSNDKSWGSAIWQGEANAVIEDYSEVSGVYIDKILGKAAPHIAKVFGGRRISGMLARANASDYGRILATTREHLQRLGVSDYFGEVGEEYYGQLWRTMINLDDAYTNVPIVDEQGNQVLDADGNPVYERKNLLFTGQFHGDIWGGMALSMGLMGAGKYAISGIAYGSMKHQVNKADKRAAEIFTSDRWEPIREIIDSTTNDDMGALAESMVNDPNLSDEERAAVMGYMERSLNLRGFNLGAMAQSRGAKGNPMEQELSKSYIDGYEAVTSREMNDARNMRDYQRQRLVTELGLLGNDDIERIMADYDSDPVGALMRTHGAGLREMARDYVNAKAVYDGMIQGVRDNIEVEIESSNAMVDGRTNRATGMIQPATMGLDDRQVYVVGGMLAVGDDGMVDRERSDESVVVRDAVTGELEFADPKSIVSVGEAIDPAQEKAVAADAIRQRVAQDAADRIDGRLAFNPGDVVDISAGGVVSRVSIVGPVVDGESGMPVEGQVIVQAEDGTQTAYTKDELQQWADAANRERLEDYERQRRGMAELDEWRRRPEVPTAKSVRLNDAIEFTDDDGNMVYGVVIQAPDDANSNTVQVEFYDTPERDGYPYAAKEFDADVFDAMMAEHRAISNEEGVTAEEPQPIGKGNFGYIYDQFKGKIKDAVNFLFKKRSGEAKGVFYRDGIGEIDLIWGDSKSGLQYIIDKHVIEQSDFDSPDAAIERIDDIVRNGEIVDYEDRVLILKDGYRVVLARTDEGRFVLTAYDTNRKINEKKRTEADATEIRQRIYNGGMAHLVSSDFGSEDKDKQNNADAGNNGADVLTGEEESLNLQTEIDDNEVSERVSQTGDGANDGETEPLSRLFGYLVAARAGAVGGEGSAEGQGASGRSQSSVSRQEVEARAAERFAKESGLWIPMQDVFSLGRPGPSGNENDTYISPDNKYYYKVNNLMNSDGEISRLLEKVRLHNEVFPNTAYELTGLTGFDGRSIMPVMRQRLVADATNATPEEIAEYMSQLGFTQTGEYEWRNGEYELSDMRPRNVLKDADGDIYVIDAEISERQTALSRIPVDEQGQHDFTAVDKDTAWDGLMEAMEGEEDAQAWADGMVKASEKDVKAAEKVLTSIAPDPSDMDAFKAARREARMAVEQARARADRWRGIAGVQRERVRAAEEAEKARIAAEKEAEAQWRAEKQKIDKRLQDAAETMRDCPEAVEILQNMQPQDMWEVAAQTLSGHKILLNDQNGGFGIRHELGYSQADVRRLFGLFARKENGGRSIAELAGDVMKENCMAAGVRYDETEAYNALLDVVHSASTVGDIRNYVADRRLQQADDYYGHWAAQLAADEPAYYQERYHMGKEEYEAYEEELERGMSELTPEDLQDIDEIFIDAFTLRDKQIVEREKRANNGRKDFTESSDSSGSVEILPGSPSDRTGGSSAVESRESAETGGKSIGQNGIASESAPAERDSRQGAEGLTLSEETDHNDLPLLTASDGTTTFGAIRAGEGIEAGIIKLSLGFDRIVNVGGKDIHRGYGYEHIEAQRGDVIRAAGFRTVADFVEYVSKSYTSIKRGGKRNGKDTFIIEVPQNDGKDTNVLYIELSADGEYWNVNSGGIFRSDYTRKKEEVAQKEKTDNSLPALETSPATVDGKVQDTSEGGNPLSGNSSLSESSDGKGSNSVTEKQEVGSKSSSQSEVSGRITLGERVKAAEAEVNTDPTPAQKEAGNYKKGHVQVGTFAVTIEQPVGSVRRGTDADGKEWEPEMQNTYGYIRGTQSVDGDHIDVFLSTDIDGWNGRRVVIVDQYNPDGSFDEHKVMLGFNDMEDARGAYLSNYEQGWEKGRRLVFSSTDIDDFEKWIESSHRKQKPYHEYKIADKAEVEESNPENPVSTTEQEAPADYTIDTYTTKKGKTYHRVVFPRADKSVWQERLNLAKKMGGTSVPKGYGFKTKEEAENFAKAVSGKNIIFAPEGGKGSSNAEDKVWSEMDGGEREVYAAANPLTRAEIEATDVDPTLKANALAYLDGRRGIIQRISYLNLYDYVRNPNGNSAGVGTNADETQLAGADTESLGGRRPGDGDGSAAGVMDTERESAYVPEESAGGQNSERVDVSASGEGDGRLFSDETSAMGGIFAGSDGRHGSGHDRRIGDDGGDKRRGSGKKDFGTTGVGKSAARSTTDGTADVAVNNEIDEALSEFKAAFDEFLKAGRDTLSISVGMMSSRQLELLPRVISAGAKIGYALIKQGISNFAEWGSKMRGFIGSYLNNAGLSDTEVDAWIEEMWDCDYTIGGTTRKISEWASIENKDRLREQVRMSLDEKRKAQKAAEPIAVKVADADNIRETLPYLLPQQQEDVRLAEVQFFDESHNDEEHAYGKGYMFTNGTGTGKTYTGLGIVKRFVKQGKGRILILTPSQPKVTDWINDGKNLGLNIRSLDDWSHEHGGTATAEKGDGVVITTYANFRQNQALGEDCFDLIVYDESHRLLENKKGEATTGVAQHYRLSNKNESYAFQRLRDVNPVYRRMIAAQKEFNDSYQSLVSKAKKESGYDNIFHLEVNGYIPPAGASEWSPAVEHKFPELTKLRNEITELENRFREDERPILETQAKEDAKRTKVVFLSATPFNTRENIDYAEGYLFSYPKDEDGSYNVPKGRSRFFLDHFGAGYKWRYHRLENSAENAEALSRQEIEFSDWLQLGLQTMSGRTIDSEYDYSRDFPTVTGEYAQRFNEATSELAGSEFTRDAYYATIGNYNYGQALFESMKVAQIIPRIREHIKAGRKVAVYHRRVETKQPLGRPFETLFAVAVNDAKELKEEDRKAALAEIRRLKRKYADMLEWEQSIDLRMPRQQLADAFGSENILFFGGKESAKTKNRSVEEFNKDSNGKNIIVVQEASGKEGISLHDRSGVHPRVLITLALPQSPITALQIEGRIFRIGNRSNAILEYPLLGLDSEMILFGQTFNAQVGTTENLALGSKARNLRESFARGIEDRSGIIPFDRQGVGGKELDAGTGMEETEPFDAAILDFYTNHKISANRDSREGKDYYPTPEPLGYMMSQWGRIGEGESVLEPSAGHGAIARYVPTANTLTAIEPSSSLFSRLQIRAGGIGRKFENTTFENYNVINKHDVVLMNPPFGTGGRLAIDHVAKAFSHLEEGGRVVALIPRGGADAKFDKWYNDAKNAVMVGEVNLPDITFERAGTSVCCRVVIIDKVSNDQLAQRAAANAAHVDLSGDYTKIEDFFEELGDIEMPERTIDKAAILRKRCLAVARTLRGIKGVKEVTLGEDYIRVLGRGMWERFSWKDITEDSIREQYNTYSRWESSLEEREDYNRAEVYGELKKLCARLAGKTIEEMERNDGTSADETEDDVVYRTSDEQNQQLQELSKLTDKQRAEVEDYLNAYPGAPIMVIGEESDVAGVNLPEDYKRGALEMLDDTDTLAAYCNYDKKIYIFAKNNRGNIPMRDVMMHENVHAVADRLRSDEFNDSLESFVTTVSSMSHPRNFYRRLYDGVAEMYSPEEIAEEYLAYIMQRIVRTPAMALSISEQLSGDTLKWFNNILSSLYGKEQIGRESAAGGSNRDSAREENGGVASVQNIGNKSDKGVAGRDGRGESGIKQPDSELLRSGDGGGAYSDAEVSLANDPVSKVMGQNRFGRKQQAEFAARERHRMANRIQELAERMHLDNVEVITDASQLEGKRAKAKGFYNKRTGKITIVIPNNVSTIDAEQTLLHEAVAHYGLRQLFGEQFNTFLDNVYGSADESIRRKIAEMAAKNGWDFRTATEEYLAGLAEDTNFGEAQSYTGWWSKIKRLFLDMLEKIGFEGFRDKTGVVLTDNELRYLLWRSYENLVEPGRYRSILGEAADVARQSELKVGNYAEQGIDAEYAAEPGEAAAELDEINKRFNKELERYDAGTLPQGHRFELGMPSRYLRSAGFPNLPISMRASLLKLKSGLGRHPFEAKELRGLVESMQKPIAIFSYTKDNVRNIIVDVKHGDKHFLVGVTLNYKAGEIEINSVSGLFPKDNQEWLKWIQDGKAIRIDQKEKVQQIIDSLRMNPGEAERIGLDLEDAAKIVDSFENPTIEGEELFRPGDFSPRDKAVARDTYNRICASGGYQFKESVQDSMLGLKTLYRSILGKNTRIEDVAGFENAYLFENRMSSMNAGEQHEYFQRYMQPLLKEIGRIVGANKRKRRELTDYLMAKHGLERNEYMRNEAAANGDETDRDFAGLIGLTGEADWQSAETTARQWVDDYEKMVDTTALWQEINNATKATLEKVYLSGIISKETYEKILGMYQFYVPLRGWDETTSEQVYGYLTSKDGPLGGSIMKKAEGRESMADDPIATIGMMADDAIRQGNRNLMKQRFLNFVLNHPSDAVSVHDIWLEYDDVSDEWRPVFADVENTDTTDEVAQKVEAFEQRMESLRAANPDKYKKGREAQNIPYKVVNGNLREHQVLIKRNGRTFIATINGNPRAAQAINGLTNPDVDQNGVVGNMLKAGTWVNRQLSAFYTTRNPDFVVSNFFRDMLYSNCMTWVKESPRYALRFHKNFGLVNPIAMRRLLGKWENGTLNMGDHIESMFYQFMMNGGETGYTNIRDIEGHKRAVAAELKKQGSTGRRVWTALGMQLDLLNRAAENCARFAAFVTSRDFGRNIDRAIYDAKEISVNFNKKGSGSKMVNATGQTKLGKTGAYLSGGGRLLYVFWNAGIQGMTNFGRQAKLHPAKFSVGATALFTLGYVIPMLAQMLGGGDGDDDDKNAYYNLPEYVRRSNICFYAGDQWITIPLPIEYRAIYGMGELAHGVISGNERYSNSELARQMASQVSQIMPIDMLEGGGGISPFIPSAAKPFTEAYIMNKGWTGLPVYKDTPFNKNDPEWTKAYASTDKHLVDFAKWLNETSGGDDFKKGAIDINPAKIEYLLNGTFGGMLTFPNKLKKSAETAFGDRDFEWRNMPIANRLIKSGDERTANRKLQNEYFKYQKEYKETERLMRKYESADENGILGYAEKIDFLESSPEYARWEIFDEFKADIDAYREAVAAETDEEERARIEAEMYAVMRELVNALHAPEAYRNREQE